MISVLSGGNLELEISVDRLAKNLIRVQFCNHSNNHFVLFNQYSLFLLNQPCTSRTNLPESCPLLIVELEASNWITGVVDADWSYLVVWISWQLMGVFSWSMRISLCRTVSIGQDPVEPKSFTILIVVLKPCEEMKHSTPLSDHGFIRKDKHSDAVWVGADDLWQLDSWKD